MSSGTSTNYRNHEIYIYVLILMLELIAVFILAFRLLIKCYPVVRFAIGWFESEWRVASVFEYREFLLEGVIVLMVQVNKPYV